MRYQGKISEGDLVFGDAVLRQESVQIVHIVEAQTPLRHGSAA